MFSVYTIHSNNNLNSNLRTHLRVHGLSRTTEVHAYNELLLMF